MNYEQMTPYERAQLRGRDAAAYATARADWEARGKPSAHASAALASGHYENLSPGERAALRAAEGGEEKYAALRADWERRGKPRAAGTSATAALVQAQLVATVPETAAAPCSRPPQSVEVRAAREPQVSAPSVNGRYEDLTPDERAQLRAADGGEQSYRLLRADWIARGGDAA